MLSLPNPIRTNSLEAKTLFSLHPELGVHPTSLYAVTGRMLGYFISFKHLGGQKEDV
jgi:hypothetical protein